MTDEQIDDGFAEALDKRAADLARQANPPPPPPPIKNKPPPSYIQAAPFRITIPTAESFFEETETANKFTVNYLEKIWQWVDLLEAIAIEPFDRLELKRLERTALARRCAQIKVEYEMGVKGTPPFGSLDHDEIKELEQAAGFKVLTFDEINVSLYMAARAMLRIISFRTKYEMQSHVNVRAINPTAFVFDALRLMEGFMEFKGNWMHKIMSNPDHARNKRNAKASDQRASRRALILKALSSGKQFRSITALAKEIKIHRKHIERDLKKDSELREIAKKHGVSAKKN